MKIVTVCGTVLLIAVAIVVALRERQQTVPRPDVPVAASPAEVRVKAVERKTGPVAEGELAAARRRDRVRRGRGDGRSLRGAERCASVDCALPDGGVRGVLVRAVREKTKPYAGTALYSLAEDKRATREQEGELKRLTLALCKPGVNNVARIAAIQLAGQRGYVSPFLGGR